MAAEMKAEGMEELSEMLEGLGREAEGIAARALYEGAGVMAKAIASEAASIRTAPFKYAKRGESRLPSPEEKAVILSAGNIGIAKFDKNGSEVDTSVGYGDAGYAELQGKRVPIALIANSINSGTSFMVKQPFIRKAANRGSREAMRAMTEQMEKDVEALTK